jgi:hypothetical protein
MNAAATSATDLSRADLIKGACLIDGEWRAADERRTCSP